MGFHVIEPEMKADWLLSTPALDGGSHWVADRAYGRVYTAPPGTEPTADFEGWTDIGSVIEPIVFTPPKGGEVIQTIGQRFSGSLKFETLSIDDEMWDWLWPHWDDQLRERRQRIRKMHNDYRAKTKRRNRRRK